MTDILKFIENNNLPQIDLGKTSNQWHKLESENFKGSYIFNITNFKDKSITILTVYNFRTGETLTERFGSESLTKGELANVQKQIDEQNEKARQEKLRKQLETRAYAQETFEAASQDPDSVWGHPYFVRKRLSSLNNGNRNSVFPRSRTNLLGNSEILIPFYDIKGTLWNFQSIDAKGEKQVLIGGRLEGLFNPLLAADTLLGDYDRIYLAEGFATALTIYLALDQKYPVLACISSTNLKYVAEEIRKRYPRTPYVICADNDCWKPDQGNAGEMAARNVVSRIDGGAFGLPDFQGCDQSGKPTDFNDLLCLAGLSEVARQVEKIKTSRPQIIYSLGYNNKFYYFTTSKVSQIQVLSDFSEADLLKLAGMNYWVDRFGDEKGKWDLQKIKDKLIRDCQERGLFEHDKMRGRGFYVDSENFLMHLGDRLYYCESKKEHDIADVDSDYYYDPTTKQFPNIKKEK